MHDENKGIGRCNITQDWSIHGGSEEPMFRYNLNATNKEMTMGTCITCRGIDKIELAHEIARTGHHNSASQIPSTKHLNTAVTKM